jgi:hypothetical protein
MATTATGRRTISSKRRTVALKSSAVILLGFLTPLLQAAAPVFKSEPLSPVLLDKVRHTTWHAGCPVAPADLRQLTLTFHGYDNATHTGTLVVHRDLASDVVRLFTELYRHNFPIERMLPVEEYGGNDDASMAANNTSAFNCRDATGKPGVFSNHSWGRAIDINPLTNPYVKGDNVLPPAGRKFLDRTNAFPGSILKAGFIVHLFESDGWTWGGRWPDRQDYQHFEKPSR